MRNTRGPACTRRLSDHHKLAAKLEKAISPRRQAKWTLEKAGGGRLSCPRSRSARRSLRKRWVRAGASEGIQSCSSGSGHGCILSRVKWLLEQEMESRRKWSAAQGGDIYNFVANEGLTGVCFLRGRHSKRDVQPGHHPRAAAQVGLLHRGSIIFLRFPGAGIFTSFWRRGFCAATHGRQGANRAT